MVSEDNTAFVYDTDIGLLKVAELFGPDDPPDHKLLIRFENGPEAAEYTRQELQYLFDLMSMSCGEAGVLRGLKIVPGYRCEFSTKWKDLVLFDGNGNYLVHDVWLDEVIAMKIAKRLHSREDYGEEHSVVVLLQQDLPEDWESGDTIECEFMMGVAFLVINHNKIYQFSRMNHPNRALLIGKMVLVERGPRLPSDPIDMYRPTRLRPVMPT